MFSVKKEVINKDFSLGTIIMMRMLLNSNFPAKLTDWQLLRILISKVIICYQYTETPLWPLAAEDTRHTCGV